MGITAHFILFLEAVALMICFPAQTLYSQILDGYRYTGAYAPLSQAVVEKYQFNGYTNFWHDIYWNAFRYGSFFTFNTPDIRATILQNKVDIAEEMGIPGLLMQEGFIFELLRNGYRIMEEPSESGIALMLEESNILAFADSRSGPGATLLSKLAAANPWKEELRSHQFNSGDFHLLNAFYLENGDKKIFAVVSGCADCRGRFKRLVQNISTVLETYALYRGWFGTGSLLHSVTIHPGHPLEIIGKGLNQGNSFFTFSGYMDYMLYEELPAWLAEVNLPVVTDVGITELRNGSGGVIYGCAGYEGLKIQDTPDEGAWIEYARSRGGFVFRPVYNPACDAYHYDGYIAAAGNKKEIDNENVPFILETGYVKDEAPSSMVLFTGKNERLTRTRMYDAIFDRRSVGIFPGGAMVGPSHFRNVLQTLLLDRVYLEEYFGSRINLTAEIIDYTLTITIANTYPVPVSGTLQVETSPAVGILDSPVQDIAIPGRKKRTVSLRLRPSAGAMGRVNPVAVEFSWNGKTKNTLAILNLPPAISVHRLLYGQEPALEFPATIHNFSAEEQFPVTVQVTAAGDPGEIVYEAVKDCRIPTGTFQTLRFALPLAPGSYGIRTAALGAEAETQAGIGEGEGYAYAYRVDLDGDGVDEYRMENDYVRVTLLATGARIIEYIIKENEENVFFKLWPRKSESDRRPFRERGFYPYGGFEDFLGQGSMETHHVYDAEMIDAGGKRTSVTMSADFFGNRIEKTYTLYGDSPLIEARFALEFRNAEANMLGPQPILELGDRHWTEDIFTVPLRSGLREIRMRPGIGKRYGLILDLMEGWNAGYDPEAGVSFIGAFPVSEPEFLHMFTNDPGNSESNFYYLEFQPWVPIIHRSIMYFTYYFWAEKGPWENGLRALRERNLITSR